MKPPFRTSMIAHPRHCLASILAKQRCKSFSLTICTRQNHGARYHIIVFFGKRKLAMRNGDGIFTKNLYYIFFCHQANSMFLPLCILQNIHHPHCHAHLGHEVMGKRSLYSIQPWLFLKLLKWHNHYTKTLKIMVRIIGYNFIF